LTTLKKEGRSDDGDRVKGWGNAWGSGWLRGRAWAERKGPRVGVTGKVPGERIMVGVSAEESVMERIVVSE
jgi:hypothetical protein